MKILKVTLINYRSYEKAVIDFSRFGSIIGILGKTGSGKSSIIEAIPYAIWGEFRDTSEDDLIRDSQNEMIVIVEFEISGRLFVVERKRVRSKTSSVKFSINGVDQSSVTNVTAVNPIIVREIGFDAALFYSISFFRQGQNTEFVDATAADRRSQLSKIIDTSIFLLAAERSRSLKNNVEKDVLKNSGELRLYSESISSFNASFGSIDRAREKILALETSKAEVERVVVALRQRYHETNAKINEIKSHYQGRLDASIKKAAEKSRSIASYRLEIEKANHQIEVSLEYLRIFNKKVQDHNALVEKFKDVDFFYDDLAYRDCLVHAASLRKEIEIRARTLSKINSSSSFCQECLQPVSEEHILGKKSEIESSIQLLNKSLEEMKNEIIKHEKQKKISDEYSKIASSNPVMPQNCDDEYRNTQKEKIAACEISIKSLQEELDEIAKSIESIKIGLSGLPELESEIASLKRDGVSKGAEVDEFTKTILRISSAIESFEKSSLKASEIESSLRISKHISDNYDTLSAAFGVSIPSMIIENVCGDVSNYANAILEKARSSYRIQMKTQKTIKSGESREVIDFEIISGSDKIRKYKSLSGGQKATINLSIRFALAELLCESKKVSIECAFLDEVFAGIDSVSLTNIISLIVSLKDKFKNIFIVTHDEEFKAFIPDTVAVYMNNETSEVSSD